VNQSENSQLYEILARVIFSSGSPTLLVENEEWMTFIEKLRQIYKLPSRSTLSNKLLENEYQRVEALVITKLAEMSVIALQSDAWSNQRNLVSSKGRCNNSEPLLFLQDPGTYSVEPRR
jgi:hypothetical protein